MGFSELDGWNYLDDESFRSGLSKEKLSKIVSLLNGVVVVVEVLLFLFLLECCICC